MYIYIYIYIYIIYIRGGTASRTPRETRRASRQARRGTNDGQLERIAHHTLATANIYTYTPIIQNTVYIILIRRCKHLLVVVYKFLSCTLAYYIDGRMAGLMDGVVEWVAARSDGEGQMGPNKSLTQSVQQPTYDKINEKVLKKGNMGSALVGVAANCMLC